MGNLSIETKKNTGPISVLLNQGGPARTPEMVVFKSPPPQPDTRRTELTRIRAEQTYIKLLLGVEHMSDIPTLRYDQAKREKAVENAEELIAGNYDLSPNTVKEAIKGYAELADRVIEYTVKDLPPEFADHGRESQIKELNHPVDLAIAMFDNDLPRIERFRALRKLLLMRMAASLDQKERDGQSEKAYQQLTNFFQDPFSPVFDAPGNGENTRRYILSTHDSDTFATTDTRIITNEERNSIQLADGQKLTPVERRTFTLNTKSGPQTVNIYFHEGTPGSPRKKQREVMLLKQLRDGRENPALSVDDQIGFMAIFEQPSDANLFLQHLSDHAVRRYHMLSLEKVKDTLEDPATKPHGTPTLRWLKAMLHMDGMRPEFIAHTPDSFTDYRYRDGLSHAEYANTRLFKEGVIELLFPPELYNYDIQDLYRYAATKVRTVMREPK